MVIPRPMSTGSERLVLEAPAKVNLFLEVIGKLANGYHELRSLIVPVSLSDTVEIEVIAGDITLSLEADGVAGSGALSGRAQDNLVVRAAHALRRATGCSCCKTGGWHRPARMRS